MAIVTNTQTSFASIGNREDLHDVISMISPAETPLYSMLSDRPVKAVKHEWQIDALAAPSTANAQIEGDVYTYSAFAATSRVGNFCQIFRKTQILTKTQEVVDKAGRKSEVAYQKTKMGQEIKTDVEVTMLSNQASVAGDATTPRKMGSLRAWIATNDSMSGGGSSGGYNAGTGVVDAATNGSAQRAFTKTLLDDTIQATYTAGGNPTVLLVSPYVKRVFSTFMSDANVAQLRMASTSSQATLVGAADAYLSDFGLIDVIPNRQMARVGATVARNAFLIDKDKAHKGCLRRIGEAKDAHNNSDGKPIVLIGECTLVVDNEAAHGVVADLFGMSAAA
jgi:hypothetical protein